MEASRRLDHPAALGALSALGDLVATGSWKAELRLWNARKGQLMGTCPSPVGSVRSLALCDEPPRLLVSGADGLGLLLVGDTGLVTHLPAEDAAAGSELSLSTVWELP